MGNCQPCQVSRMLSADFVAPEELIIVTRSDGKKLGFTAPIIVRDLMAAYPHHSVVQQSGDATCRYLSAEQKLVPGKHYRLLLHPNLPSLSKYTALTEAKCIGEHRISRERRESTPPFSVHDGSGITRVKMVISKRELESILSECSMRDKPVLLQLQSKVAKEDHGATRRCSSGTWRPSLEGIPELN